MSEKKRIVRATGVVGGATLLSRISGLVRDMVIAHLFGAGNATDAFFTAFTLPNLLRRFFAEGTLTAAFVPIYSEVYHRDGHEAARRLADACATLLVLAVGAVTVFGVLASPLLVRMLGYGFGDVAGKLALTDLLNQLMFPYLLFVSILALLTGMLNVLGHYFLPAISPVLLNLAMIGAAWGLAGQLEVPVVSLGLGVLIGGCLQLLLQIPALLRYRVVPRFRWPGRGSGAWRVCRLMIPGVLGVAIYQVNIVVARLLSSFLPAGSVSYLYYAQRLFEFPQGIFVIALAQALLPSLSRQAAAGNMEELKDQLHFALSLLLVVTLPAAIGLVYCAEPVFGLFFLGGSFDAAAVSKTAMALAAYAPGLVFVGLSRILAPTFYALQDTRTPVMISCWTLLVHAGLGILLMQRWNHVGLAAALTVSAAFNAVVLAVCLRRRLGPVGGRRLLRTFLRLIPALILLALVCRLGLGHVNWVEPGAVWTKGAHLAATVFLGAGVFAVCAAWCGVEELRQLFSLCRQRIRGR